MAEAHPKLKLETGDVVRCRLWYAYHVPPFKGKGEPELKLTLQLDGPDQKDANDKLAFYGSLALVDDLRGLGMITGGPDGDGRFEVQRGRPWIILEKRNVPQGQRQIFVTNGNGEAPAAVSSSSQPAAQSAPAGNAQPSGRNGSTREPRAIRDDWRGIMEATVAAARIAAVAMGEALNQIKTPAGLESTPVDQQALSSLIATILIRGEKLGVGTYPGMTKGKACLFCGTAEETDQ